MIYFVRHGESEANVRNVFAGQRDNSNLTEKGREQAKSVGEKLAAENIKIDTVVASPLNRTFNTAKIIAEIIGFPEDQIKIDKRLLEYDTGSLSGMPSRNILSSELVSAPEAENPIKFRLRIESILNECKDPGKNVLLISHAGVGRMIEATKAKSDPSEFYDFPSYPNGSIVKLDWVS